MPGSSQKISPKYSRIQLNAKPIKSTVIKKGFQKQKNTRFTQFTVNPLAPSLLGGTGNESRLIKSALRAAKTRWSFCNSRGFKWLFRWFRGCPLLFHLNWIFYFILLFFHSGGWISFFCVFYRCKKFFKF